MIRKMPLWVRSLLIVSVGIVFFGVTAAIVYAVQNPFNPPYGGQTRAGDHNWRDVQVEGDDLCRECHFAEHNVHGGNTTCSDCHAPNPGDHAARVVTCRTCHGMGGGGRGFTTQDSPLPDPTTTTSTTTSSTTSTTAAPTSTSSSTTTSSTSTTAAPTTTSSTTSTTTAP